MSMAAATSDLKVFRFMTAPQFRCTNIAGGIFFASKVIARFLVERV
jgi:hypothetical protein